LLHFGKLTKELVQKKVRETMKSPSILKEKCKNIFSGLESLYFLFKLSLHPYLLSLQASPLNLYAQTVH